MLMLARRVRFPTGRMAASAAISAVAATTLSLETRKPSESQNLSQRPRVLITGFHDWRDLDGNIWRCRDNPSCRLLLGSECPSPPIRRDGPLPQALRFLCAEVADFTFVTLPVLWGTSAGLDLLSYDIVIHLGLGVYDRDDLILVETDAYNMRRGADALAHAPPGQTIEMGSDQVLERSSGMHARYARLGAGLAEQLPGDFQLSVAKARPANSYICNETHWRALRAQLQAHEMNDAAAQDDRRRLQAAYFLHLPRARDENHCELANAVAEVVRRILKIEEVQWRM